MKEEDSPHGVSIRHTSLVSVGTELSSFKALYLFFFPEHFV